MNSVSKPQTMFQQLKSAIGSITSENLGDQDIGPIGIADPLERIGIRAANAGGLFDQRAWMAKVIAFAEGNSIDPKEKPRGLLLSRSGPAPQFLTPAVAKLVSAAEAVPFLSLNPADYKSLMGFVTATELSPGIGPKKPLHEMCPLQIAHLLNVSYVRAALRFVATATGDFRLTKSPGVAEPGPTTPFLAVFDAPAHAGSKKTINLESAHLFSLSRWIDSTLDSAWKVALDHEIEECAVAMAKEVDEVLTRVGYPLEPRTVSELGLRGELRNSMLATSAFVRLHKGAKAHVDIQAINSAMRKLNADLDREVLSIAVRFSPRNSLTFDSYQFFARDDVRQSLTKGTLKGAFAPLALPDAFLLDVYRMPAGCALAYKKYLSELEASCSEPLHRLLSEQSPSYFLRFPRTRAVFENSDGPKTKELDGFLEAGLADPIEAARIMASALNSLVETLGAKSLPPGELLVSNATVMHFLGGKKQSTSFGISDALEPVGKSIDHRIHGLSMLMGEVAMIRRRRKATIDSAVNAVSTRETDYLDSPSLDALIALRSPKSASKARSRALALRAALHLNAPLTTSAPGRKSNAAVNWDLVLIDLVPPQEVTIYGNWAHTSVSKSGPVYQLSFRSRDAKAEWIHLRFAALRCLDGQGDVTLRTRHPHESAVPLYHVTSPDPIHGTLTIAETAPGSGGSDRFRGVVDLGRGQPDASTRLFASLCFNALADVYAPVMARRSEIEGDRLAALTAHSDSLVSTLIGRIKDLAKFDPAVFSTLFSNQSCSVLDIPELASRMPEKIGDQKSLRLAAIGSSMDPRVVEEVAARMSNPFTTTRSGGSIVDVCEAVQSSLNSNRADLTPLQAVLKGLAKNPACIADKECFSALLERSMLKCLEKEPRLMTEFLRLGVKPDDDCLQLLEGLHPQRVTAEITAAWTAARMHAQISKAQAEHALVSSGPSASGNHPARRPRVRV